MQPSIYKVAALILLSALGKGQLPEDDFRIVQRRDVLDSNYDIFEDKDGGWFSQLLFDVGREQVIVGGRDALYRLSLRGLKALERSEWPASTITTKLCQDKGQSELDCHNYVKVLLSYDHKLFACGTNAFSPVCSWREMESINTVSNWVKGIANCPHNPHSNVTALLTSEGEYYAGTPTDFTSSDTTIFRSQGASHHPVATLRSPQYDFNWLNEPQFVGSFQDDMFVYFVFRENAVEFMNCGKSIYSRIARVCKNDSGGHLMLKDKWSTFLKARLVCSIPGSTSDVPFYYDEVQSVQYIAQDDLLVATFTTHVNSIAGSAVCVYNMSDVHASFEGPYKVKESPASSWDPRSPSQHTRDHFRCLPDTGSHQSIEYHQYHLMYESIEPISGAPIYKSTLERFTHLTTDVVVTNAGNQLVLFVATLDSDILKLTVLPGLDGACLVERWKMKDGFDILKIQFVKDTMSLYISTTKSIIRVPSTRCASHTSASSCLLSDDAHCTWREVTRQCVMSPRRVNTCSRRDTPVDGGWSTWSEWRPCPQRGTSTTYGDEVQDACMCRLRRCDSPAKANGGLDCDGADIAVTNCTVHGGWSGWSSWSECTATCGIAAKFRRRSCTAPAPQHGGQTCRGQDTQEVYCNNLPPCPDPDLAPVDGGWSAWSSWSECSHAAACGGGVRERRRACSQPQPRRGGAECAGGRLERQPCDARPHAARRSVAWTPWVQLYGNSTDGSYTEKRFKFLCKVPEPEQIKLSVSREEERYCNGQGECTSSPPEEGWSAWGAWGACSAPCGGGQQVRTRECRTTCTGSTDMIRSCNTHACSGEWSCWSDWSKCEGDCAAGVYGRRTRSRRCLSPEGCVDAGAALETSQCVLTCAESEDGWGAWSKCDNGEKIRRKNCRSGGPCLHLKLTDLEDVDNELYAMPDYTPNVQMASFINLSGKESMSVGGIVGCIIASFAMGCFVCLAGIVYIQRRGTRLPWRRQTRVPSSPHYITAKQNSYVTVPLKDVPRKAKRQPSFSGIGGASGILLSKSNNLANANNQNNTMTTPKLYPKAIANEYDSMGTLRRHSNQPNNRNNLDSEEDKFY